jgi:hypothetical protein
MVVCRQDMNTAWETSRDEIRRMAAAIESENAAEKADVE